MVSVCAFISDPVWNVSAIVWLNALGNGRSFYITRIVSDGDKFVLRSQFPLEKWHHVTSAFTLLPYFCMFLVWLLLVEQF